MNLRAVSAGGSCRLEGCEFRVKRFRKILDMKEGTRKDKGDKRVLNRRYKRLNGVSSGERRNGGRQTGTVAAVVSMRWTTFSEDLRGGGIELAASNDSY